MDGRELMKITFKTPSEASQKVKRINGNFTMANSMTMVNASWKLLQNIING